MRVAIVLTVATLACYWLIWDTLGEPLRQVVDHAVELPVQAQGHLEAVRQALRGN